MNYNNELSKLSELIEVFLADIRLSKRNGFDVTYDIELEFNSEN